MKKCSKCKAVKPFIDFNKGSANKDGLEACCRDCKKAFYRSNKRKILDKQAEYYEKNKQSLLDWQEKYRSENKEAIRSRSKAYRENNKEKVAFAKSEYYRKNKDSIAAYHAEYRTKNKERKREVDAAYYFSNRERRDALSAKWIQRNPDRRREISRQWAKRNSESGVVNRNNRRARILRSGGTLSAGLLNRLFILQRGMCPCCKEPLGDDYHLDHIVPLAKGGENTNENSQLLRATCNLQKSAKDPVEFMQSRGFLL